MWPVVRPVHHVLNHALRLLKRENGWHLLQLFVGLFLMLLWYINIIYIFYHKLGEVISYIVMGIIYKKFNG